MDALLGAVLGAAIPYLVMVAYRWLRGIEGMGLGDVKLLAMIGAFLGWQKAILTFFVAPFLGVAVGIYTLIAKKDHTIPYGPFLALAALFSMFWASAIIRFLIFR